VDTQHDTGDDPSTKLVLCQALQNVARSKPEVLDQRLLQALFRQLGSANAAIAGKASAALAACPVDRVLPDLQALAEDDARPLPERMAALAALTPKTHRREVVATLVGLLDEDQPELVNRVIATLQRISRKDYGRDVDAWKVWWETQERLDEKNWLAAQLAQHSEMLAELDRRFRDFRDESQQRYNTLATRLSQSLAALYRVTPPAEKDTLLQQWLTDSLPEFRRAAMGLVAEQISEGNLPSPALREALRQRFADDSPEIRRLAFEISAALNDPADAAPILARLPLEKDERVRESILRALGKLRNAEAIPALQAELEQGGASNACVIAAADALGMLAARGRVSETVSAELVRPLRERFAQAAEAPVEVRVALLGAMAAIGSPEFRPEFHANLSSDHPELLLAAIQGIAVVGDGVELDRLSTLTAHADPRVRQRALQALGALGTEQQLTTIIGRLTAGLEPVEGPRTTAWQAFKQICSRLPLAGQLAAADRLNEHPVLASEYLKELHDRLVESQPSSPALPEVRKRLAEHYMSLSRNAEALPLWRRLLADAPDDAGASRGDIALKLLRCALSADNDDAVAEALRELAPRDEGVRREAEDLVIAHVEALEDAADARGAAPFVEGLRELALTEAFPRLYARLAADRGAATPASSQNTNGPASENS
jgi:HEAT repeat protein